MTNEEINVEVARTVFGASLVERPTSSGEKCWMVNGVYLSCALPARVWGPDIRYSDGCPHFATSPTADYTVLVKVRETWTGEQMERFNYHLWVSYHARRPLRSTVNELFAVYEPGDWSRAALSALTSKEPKPNG